MTGMMLGRGYQGVVWLSVSVLTCLLYMFVVWDQFSTGKKRRERKRKHRTKTQKAFPPPN